jgi:hypothetical protein
MGTAGMIPWSLALVAVGALMLAAAPPPPGQRRPSQGQLRRSKARTVHR